MSNVIHADFDPEHRQFVSDMEDAINGLIDVIYDHYEEPVACELAKGMAAALTEVAEKIEENLGEKPASD